jgi:erythromycin esterase
VYGIWSRSEQLLPLMDYLGARAKTERPLELSGFDCHFTYKGQGKLTFTIDLLDFLSRCRIDGSRIAVGKDVRRVLDSLEASPVAGRPTEPQRRNFFDAWTAIRHQVDAVDEVAPDVSLWKQLMKSVEAYARYTLAPDSGSWAVFNIRDKQMAANLVWLAQERFKGRKIIVWAASLHNARSLNSVDTQRPAFDPAFSYEGAIPMGEHVWQALGKDMYSIGFVASEGSHGMWNGEPWTLPPVNPKSLEGLWAQTGAKLAFVDFRGLGPDEWLRTQLVAGPFGYGPMLADWTKVFDGMIFTRVMEKSRRAER